MNQKTFIEACRSHGIDMDDEKIKKYERYMELLLEWNQKMNLTAITNPEEIWEKHFLDSILPFQGLSFQTFCDVGSGAGFPCIPLKIAFDSVECTMIEPLQKRCRFLEHVIQELELKNIRVINSRAEDYAKDHRELFDCVSARAVARLNILLELCTPLCKVEGKLIFLKGKSGMEELKEAQKALDVLDLKFEKKEIAQIEEAEHINLYFSKKKKTSLKYPRNYGQIKKKPIGG